jgi:hypothetical protein
MGIHYPKENSIVDDQVSTHRFSCVSLALDEVEYMIQSLKQNLKEGKQVGKKRKAEEKGDKKKESSLRKRQKRE